MTKPVVAVVGRPNVGKSTFVNRVSQRPEAIVHETQGVTRDRTFHDSDWNGVEFSLCDTGGIEVGDANGWRRQPFQSGGDACEEGGINGGCHWQLPVRQQ